MQEVKIYNKISEINKENWDRLAEDNIFLCYAWLKTFEEAAANPLLPYYITLRDGEEIIAASVCYFEKKKENSRSIDNILLGRFIKFKWIKNHSFLPAVMCGSKNGYGSHFLFSKELKENEIISLYDNMIGIIENIAEKNNSSVCFSNVMDNERALIQILSNRGYYETISLPLNYIDIKWSSFDDYKKSVSKEHPSMKKTIPRDINKNRKAGIEIKVLQNTEEHEERLFQLLKMNHDKYNIYSITLKPDYILKLRENFGSDAVFFTASKGEDIVGVCIELKKNNKAALTRVGIDHEISKSDLTYFNIVFYEPIKNAIEKGIEKIYCGNAFYSMKGRRGFKAANTYIFYKPDYSRFNYIIKLWFLIHKLWMKRKFSFIKENE
jgi:predicted N-acyltransferase